MTGWQLGSLDLRTLAHEISTVDGWDAFPGLKAAPGSFVYQHGDNVDGRRFYRARDIDLHVVLLDTNSSGVVTTSPAEHLQSNMDALMGALHSSTGLLTLTRTMPDASTRVARVRPIGISPVTRFMGLVKACVVTLHMPYPFWHGASQSHSGGSASVSNAGNAPVNDMVVTFTTAGRITTPNGDYLESADAGVVVNVGTGAITGNTAAVAANRPWWLQFEPGSTALTITGGSKGITWFDGWF